MKFLCIDCDTQMAFDERQIPGDGTFAASFACPSCGRRIAMLANEMETQLVNAMDVRIGGRTLREEPMQLIRTSVSGRAEALEDIPSTGGGAGRVRPVWSRESEERLARVPGFVRGMVKKIYADYAAERGIVQITPDVMDRARSELGLEGM